MVDELLTVKQFIEKHPAFTNGSIRALIFNAQKNGLSKALRRIGGRVLIKEKDFFNWIEEINNVEVIGG